MEYKWNIVRESAIYRIGKEVVAIFQVINLQIPKSSLFVESKQLKYFNRS